MKAGAMVPSKYLKSDDIEGDEVVTISKIGQVNVGKDGAEDMKWAIRFNEKDRPFVLNKTNITRIVKALKTDETEEWLGKKITLYVDHEVQFAGDVVSAIRVRATAPGPDPRKVPGKPGTALSDMDDDVPF